VVSCSSLPCREDIWFDDVDPADIEAAIGPEAARIARRQLGQRESSISLVKEQAFSGYAGLGVHYWECSTFWRQGFSGKRGPQDHDHTACPMGVGNRQGFAYGSLRADLEPRFITPEPLVPPSA
jgi:hypothetical protein